MLSANQKIAPLESIAVKLALLKKEHQRLLAEQKALQSTPTQNLNALFWEIECELTSRIQVLESFTQIQNFSVNEMTEINGMIETGMNKIAILTQIQNHQKNLLPEKIAELQNIKKQILTCIVKLEKMIASFKMDSNDINSIRSMLQELDNIKIKIESDIALFNSCSSKIAAPGIQNAYQADLAYNGLGALNYPEAGTWSECIEEIRQHFNQLINENSHTLILPSQEKYRKFIKENILSYMDEKGKTTLPSSFHKTMIKKFVFLRQIPKYLMAFIFNPDFLDAITHDGKLMLGEANIEKLFQLAEAIFNNEKERILLKKWKLFLQRLPFLSLEEFVEAIDHHFSTNTDDEEALLKFLLAADDLLKAERTYAVINGKRTSIPRTQITDTLTPVIISTNELAFHKKMMLARIVVLFYQIKVFARKKKSVLERSFTEKQKRFYVINDTLSRAAEALYEFDLQINATTLLNDRIVRLKNAHARLLSEQKELQSEKTPNLNKLFCENESKLNSYINLLESSKPDSVQLLSTNEAQEINDLIELGIKKVEILIHTKEHQKKIGQLQHIKQKIFTDLQTLQRVIDHFDMNNKDLDYIESILKMADDVKLRIMSNLSLFHEGLLAATDRHDIQEAYQVDLKVNGFEKIDDLKANIWFGKIEEIRQHYHSLKKEYEKTVVRPLQEEYRKFVKRNIMTYVTKSENVTSHVLLHEKMIEKFSLYKGMSKKLMAAVFTPDFVDTIRPEELTKLANYPLLTQCYQLGKSMLRTNAEIQNEKKAQDEYKYNDEEEDNDEKNDNEESTLFNIWKQRWLQVTGLQSNNCFSLMMAFSQHCQLIDESTQNGTSYSAATLTQQFCDRLEDSFNGLKDADPFMRFISGIQQDHNPTSFSALKESYTIQFEFIADKRCGLIFHHLSHDDKLPTAIRKHLKNTKEPYLIFSMGDAKDKEIDAFLKTVLKALSDEDSDQEESKANERIESGAIKIDTFILISKKVNIIKLIDYLFHHDDTQFFNKDALINQLALAQLQQYQYQIDHKKRLLFDFNVHLHTIYLKLQNLIVRISEDKLSDTFKHFFQVIEGRINIHSNQRVSAEEYHSLMSQYHVTKLFDPKNTSMLCASPLDGADQATLKLLCQIITKTIELPKYVNNYPKLFRQMQEQKGADSKNTLSNAIIKKSTLGSF